MSYKALTCVMIICDTCSEPLGSRDDDCTLHYPSDMDAVAAARDADWTVTDDLHECEVCTTLRQCRDTGHQPKELPAVQVRGITLTAATVCARCRMVLTLHPGVTA